MTRLVVLVVVGLVLPGAAGAQGRNEESLRAFSRLVEVFRHPRCLNCHQSGDFPRQTDERHRHRMQVARGADGAGTPALRCTTCHQEINTADGRVPGAPQWHLAPRSMGWEGLADGALCRSLKNLDRNGQRSLPDLVKHVMTDPLVQWAWSPGDRTTPAMSRHEFHETVKRWVSTGAACPS